MICPMCGKAMVRKRDRVGLDARRRYYYQCLVCTHIHVPQYDDDETAGTPVNLGPLDNFR